jgi:hypothetical protein
MVLQRLPLLAEDEGAEHSSGRGCAAADVGSHESAADSRRGGHAAGRSYGIGGSTADHSWQCEGRAERSMPVRVGQEIQEVLRAGGLGAKDQRARVAASRQDRCMFALERVVTSSEVNLVHT